MLSQMVFFCSLNFINAYQLAIPQLCVDGIVDIEYIQFEFCRHFRQIEWAVARILTL